MHNVYGKYPSVTKLNCRLFIRTKDVWIYSVGRCEHVSCAGHAELRSSNARFLQVIREHESLSMSSGSISLSESVLLNILEHQQLLRICLSFQQVCCTFLWDERNTPCLTRSLLKCVLSNVPSIKTVLEVLVDDLTIHNGLSCHIYRWGPMTQYQVYMKTNCTGCLKQPNLADSPKDIQVLISILVAEKTNRQEFESSLFHLMLPSMMPT